MITTVTLNASIDKAYHMDKAIENGTVMRVAVCRNTAGGKGLNVARVIKICGSDVEATGMVGGFNGRYLESMLEDDGIRNRFYHIDGETRSCINILDEKYGSTEYLEPGCQVKETEWQDFVQNVFAQLIADSDVVTMSGSAPKGLPKDIYAKLIKIAQNLGKKVILDTSGELLKEGLKAKPTMIKPNKDEIEALFGVKIKGIKDVKQYAKEIHSKGIPYVVVSLGGDGAMLVSDKGICIAKSPELEVVNTVGCGDSMVAAFAVALEKNMEEHEALKYAVSIASANACSPDTGNFDTDVQKEIYSQVEVVYVI